MRIVASALFAACVLTGSATAAPITTFYDQSDWTTATAGLPVGPYTGQVTLTKTVSTIVFTPGGFDILDTHTESEASSGFPSFDVTYGFHCPEIVGLTCTGVVSTSLVLDSPISGFAAMVRGAHVTSDLDFDSSGFPEFRGFLGPLASIEVFGGYTDNPAALLMSDILVVTVDEPGALSLLMAGLMVMASRGVRGRRRTAGAHLAS